jgi:serine/threonine-protein kinase
MVISTGSQLADRYEITAPIATGGMGEVWKARDRVLDRVVAAKVLRSEYTGDPNFLARFRNEARHTAGLTHPNIASVYDYGETTDDSGNQQLAFLVMEFVEGEPLVTILHDEGQLPVDWTLHVLGQSADGLSAAHRAGVVHRDIKPGNLMVRPDGVVKLTDFGIAQARDATPLTRTGMVVGTAQYLSPEQAQGMEVTAASDVYSLGVVAYECLAGVRPFDGASQVAIALAHINRPPPPLPAHVPPAVRLLVERALAKDPADRFPDGAAFAEAIRRVAAGGSPVVGAPATAPSPAVGRTAVDGRTQVFGAVTAAAVAAAGSAGVAAGAGPAPAGPRTSAPRPMPPLHAPDDDDDRAGASPPGRPAADRRRTGWIAAASVLLLLIAVGAWFLLDPLGDDGTAAGGPSASATASSSATAAAVVLADLVGRPAGEVAQELERRGFTVDQEPASAAIVAEGAAAAARPLAPGEVAGVDPVAPDVPLGETVVLYVVPAAAPQDDAVETESAPVTTTSSAPPPTSSAPTTTSQAPPADEDEDRGGGGDGDEEESADETLPGTTAATTTPPATEPPTTAAPTETSSAGAAGAEGPE